MKPWWRAIVSLLAGAGIVALAACSSSKLPERFHTLLPAEHAASAAPSAPPLYIDVLPVSVPAQVDHAQWVVRQPDDSLLAQPRPAAIRIATAPLNRTVGDDDLRMNRS